MKKFYTFLLSIILIFPCLFLFSACNDEKILNEIAFYSGENKLIANATFDYNSGEEITILGSSLSVKAIYDDNTISTLSPNEFDYIVIFSENTNFDNGTTTQNLPNSTSNVGHYKITASYKSHTATIFININKVEIHVDYKATVSKTENKPIYFGDNYDKLNFNLTPSEETDTTTELTNKIFYVIDATTLESLPSAITNKAKYILETDGINYTPATEVSSLNIGDYYIFATFTKDEQTEYSIITNSSKFTINKMPISIKTAPNCNYTFSHLDYKEFVTLSELNNNFVGGEIVNIYGENINASTVDARFEFVDGTTKIDCTTSTPYKAKLLISADKTNYCLNSEACEFNILPVLQKGLIPVAEPTFSQTSFDGNSHSLTISNLSYYSIVSGTLEATNAGTYTTVIKPKYTQNYNIDWNLELFGESDYSYYKSFETFATNAIKGNITELSINKTSGEISITWKIDKAEYTEGICLGEYFDMRASYDINTSIIPYSFDNSNIYFRVALYSMDNKNTFLNSYANSNLKISLLDNSLEAVLIKDNLTNVGDTNIDVNVTNSIFIAIPLANFKDGSNLNYKITIAETDSHKSAEFLGNLTLNNISANFTSSNIAVGAGTTLESINNQLFSNLDAIFFTWYNANEFNEQNPQQGIADLTAPIAEGSYILMVSMDEDTALEDDILYSTLETILTAGNATFNFEIYAQDNKLLDGNTYSYEKDNNSYKLGKFGKNIIYLASAGDSFYYKFVGTSQNIGYYEIYLANDQGIETNNKVGIYTQGQLSHFVNLYFIEFNANGGKTTSII